MRIARIVNFWLKKCKLLRTRFKWIIFANANLKIMNRNSLLILLFALLPLYLCAQSRAPEIKIEQKYKTEKDTSGYDERPYFILIEQSEKALAEEDYESAGLRLVEAMGMEPDNELNVALLSNLGMIYYYNDQDSLALVVLNEAIKRAPKLIAAHENKARVLTGLGRDKEAFLEYENILAIDSLHLESRFMHGMIALYGGNLNAAESDFSVLNSVVPESKKTWLALGTLYSMTGREQEAISYFRKLIELDPAVEYYARLIACMIVLDDLDGASKMMGDAMVKYPSDPELFFYRALLNKKRYLSDDAKRDAKRAIELGADPERVKLIFSK